MLLRRIARPLLSTVFIGQGIETLRNPSAATNAARPTVDGLRKLPPQVAAKVPADPEPVARINAAAQIGGGVLLATGKMPRLAASVLAATVIPGGLGVHMFWAETDPERRAEKRRGFLTDVSLLGGLLIAAADTAGKPSLGWRGRRAGQRLSEAVSTALPTGGSASSLADAELGEKLGHGLQVGAERGREWISAVSDKSEPLVEAARRHGAELAEVARERGTELAEVARERGTEWAHALPRSTG